MTAPWIALAEGSVGRPGDADAGPDALAAVVESTRSGLGALSGPRGVRDRSGRLAAAASIRAARASAALDGAPLSPARTTDPETGAVGDPVLAGAIRVAGELGTMGGIWRRAPLQALARLHTLAAADLVAADRLGRPRSPGPDDAAIGRRLSALAELIVRPPWAAPVLVAVVHAELATMRAFGSADGVVARAAARLTMITSGLEPSGLAVPEVAHLRSGAAYRDGLRAYAQGGPDGVRAWVRQECQALRRGAAQARALAEAAG